jgi:hypothetical protein
MKGRLTDTNKTGISFVIYSSNEGEMAKELENLGGEGVHKFMQALRHQRTVEDFSLNLL